MCTDRFFSSSLQNADYEMASTALNSRSVEAMVTSRPETSTSTSPMNGQDVPSAYIAQYAATLEDFARRNAGNLMNATSVTSTASPVGGDEVMTEDDEGSYDDNSSGGQKSSIASPLDSAKKRRKQSKPNKIGGGSDGGSVEGEDMDKEDGDKSRDILDSSLMDGTLRDEDRMDDRGMCFKCPHCQTTVSSPEALRNHIIGEHLGRMLSEDEIMMRHAHFTNQQKILEEQQQQQQQLQRYQQQIFAETMRLQAGNASKNNDDKDVMKIKQLEQQQQMQEQQQQRPVNNQSGRSSVEHQSMPHEPQMHHQPQQPALQHQQDPNQKPELQSVYEREEGETGPLNLSSPRWDGRSNLPPDPQRSPVTPLPASIPMPPSFADGRFNLPGLLPFGPPPFLLPFIQQNERDNPMISPGQLPNFSPGGQARIFNQEAFCDLCNKEFCNKYFLKTHKANKHGIYTDEPSCSPMPPTPPTPLGPSIPFSSNASLLAPLVHSPMTVTSIGGSPYAGAFLTAKLGNLAALRPPHPIQLPMNPKSQSSSSKSDSSISKSGVINLDAYCELCQKEFCNKYFLKRHKLKIHGVNIEVTIKAPKTNPSLDRPEGWCDACRRNIGSRSALNAHKLHVHGPHIVNHMPNNDAAMRNTMDFRAPNSLAMKQRKIERDPKDNFSPWDSMMRDREPLDNPALWNKRPKSFEGTSPRNDFDVNEGSERKDGTNTNQFDDKPNGSLPPFSSSSTFNNNINNSRMLIDNPMFSQFNDVRKIKLPQTNGLKEGTPNEVQVKVEMKPGDNLQNVPKERIESEPDPPMPILKPQNDSDRVMNVAPETNELEQRSPPILKEQALPQNRPKEEQMQEGEPLQLPAEPPRTPGGVSNSTDDSSREAGIIARVGQPAIVQAPPGTKFTPEQLRGLGVINPDAFCELCCKEFCNKYFLRTHRLKKHNIYTPEYSERSKQQFKENPPMNIARIFERQSLDYRPPSSSDIDGETECNICRRPFPSAYLLHMHKFYFHGPGSEAIQQGENAPMPEHIISQEQLRQIALQAHHQKIQEHQQFLLRQQKQQDYQIKNDEHIPKDNKGLPEELQAFPTLQQTDNSSTQEEGPSFMPNDMYEKSSSANDCNTETKSEDGGRLNKTPDNVPDASNGSTNGEADTSQELRKLQSMILGLNRHEDESITCKVCQKEIGNKYFLRAHMMTEHGILLPDEQLKSEGAQTPKTHFDINGRMPSPLNPSATDSQAYCDICKKDFFSRYILQQHMLSTHGVFTQHPGPTSFLDRIRAEVEGREDRKPHSVSRSFCDICNKELCNKYFMKTHMLKMHGINIENCSSGGVTCDICNKELCSKYFLKVHRQNTHGLVEDIRDPRDMKDGSSKERRESEETPDECISPQICPICTRKFRNLKWLRMHLTQDHGEDGKAKWREMEPNLPPVDTMPQIGPSCNICGQTQPDVVSLQIHLIKHHGDKQVEENFEDDQTMTLHCSTCSFSCSSPALLAAHESSHSPMMGLTQQANDSNGTFQCQICSHILPNIESLQQHLIGHQLQGLFEPLLAKDKINLKISDQSKKIRKRWKCKKCKLSFSSRSNCLVHVFKKHSNRPNRNITVTKVSWGKKTFKCRKCGVSQRRLGDLLSHIRSHCQDKKSLSLPVAEAQPCNINNVSEDFLMQSFVMNKEHDEGSDSQFVPSLVRLPVSRRVLQPLTVSFTLTPA